MQLLLQLLLQIRCFPCNAGNFKLNTAYISVYMAQCKKHGRLSATPAKCGQQQSQTSSAICGWAATIAGRTSRSRPLRLQAPALRPVLPPVHAAAGLAAVAHRATAAAALEAARGTAAGGGAHAWRAGRHGGWLRQCPWRCHFLLLAYALPRSCLLSGIRPASRGSGSV